MIQERIEHIDNAFQNIADKIKELNDVYKGKYEFYEKFDNNSYNYESTTRLMSDIVWGIDGTEVELKVQFIDNLETPPKSTIGGPRFFWK